MADLLPPWTIDSLDQLKASLDDLTLTLDSDLYETSVTRWDAYGSVSAVASLNAQATRVQFASASVSVSASASIDATRVQFGDASISATAAITASAIKVRTASGSVGSSV